MSNGENKKSFWTSLPGILTGIAAIISAIVGIVAAVPILNPIPPPGSIDSTKPIAIAASNPRIANEGDIITLEGIRSRDKDGDISIYEWEQIGGEPFNFDTKIANPTFKAPDVSQDTELKFSLTVRDDNNNISEPAFVTVTVKNVSQPSGSDDKNTVTDDRDNDVTPLPPNASKVTLKYEASFIPEELRNPGLKSFTHSIKVWVDARPQILDLIKKVTYYPQPSLTSFQKAVTRDSPSDNFAYSFNALEDFELKTRIYFKDGEVKDLSTLTHFVR